MVKKHNKQYRSSFPVALKNKDTFFRPEDNQLELCDTSRAGHSICQTVRERLTETPIDRRKTERLAHNISSRLFWIPSSPFSYNHYCRMSYRMWVLVSAWLCDGERLELHIDRSAMHRQTCKKDTNRFCLFSFLKKNVLPFSSIRQHCDCVLI